MKGSAVAAEVSASTNDEPSDLDSEAIRRARSILAEGRGIGLGEENEYFLRAVEFEKDSVRRVALQELLRLIHTKANFKMYQRMDAARTEREERHLENVRTRPARWAALQPQQRAAHLVAEEHGPSIGKAFLRFVELTLEPTDERTPPDSFEPENIR